MSGVAGLVQPIWANEVERQLLWRTLRERRETLLQGMLELEERIKIGHNGDNSAAWHVLDSEQHLLQDMMARVMAEGQRPLGERLTSQLRATRDVLPGMAPGMKPAPKRKHKRKPEPE